MGQKSTGSLIPGYSGYRGLTAAGVCSHLGISDENIKMVDGDIKKMIVPAFVLGDLDFC